jgi:hypothetical protein
MQIMNDGVIRRKHVGSHRRELPTLRGGLRRKASAQMRHGGGNKRPEGGKKWKGDAQRKKRDAQMRLEGGKMMKGNVRKVKGNALVMQPNVRQKKRTDV